jgi:hypothetical protein
MGASDRGAREISGGPLIEVAMSPVNQLFSDFDRALSPSRLDGSGRATQFCHKALTWPNANC